MWVDRIRKGKRERGGSGHVLLLPGSPDGRRGPQRAAEERRTQAPRTAGEGAPGEEGSRVGKGLGKGLQKLHDHGPRTAVRGLCRKVLRKEIGDGRSEARRDGPRARSSGERHTRRR